MRDEERTFERLSNMPEGTKVTMGIRVEDMAHIMSIMTDLYKNRLLACIREYSTNALDAHVEAGVSLPIEITLPSSLDPTLKIRDYGTGLDEQDIAEVYSQYGRSTKRDTNDQVGMLGLGCKSALTYGNQFTVTSIKDGKRIAVLISREEDGAGTMQTLGQPIETDEANGTEVMIAIQRGDIARARDLANDFFQYWNDGTVLVNGQPPKRFSGLKLSDSMWLVEGQGDDIVVMGNVGYPANLDLGITGKYGGKREFRVVTYTPIGTVKPTPSREALMDTKMTKDTLAALARDFKSGMKGAIQREVDACGSAQEAIRTVKKWKPYLDKSSQYSDYTYKGNAFPDGISWPYQYGANTPKAYSVMFRDGYYRKGSSQEIWDIPVDTWPETVWVQDFAPEKFNANHKDKLRKWCDENNIGQDGSIARYILLREKAPQTKFIDPALIVDWETIKKIKLDPKPSYSGYGGPARIPGSYDLYTEDGFKSEVKGADIRTNEPLYYLHGNQYAAGVLIPALKILHKKYTLVCLSKNRIAKFQRDAPMVKEVRAALKAGHKSWKANIDKQDLRAIAARNRLSSLYSIMDPHKVLDPEIKKIIRLVSRDVEAVRTAAEAFRFVERPERLTDGIDIKNPLDRYALPISTYVLREAPEHVYCYLNSAYKAGLAK